MFFTHLVELGDARAFTGHFFADLAESENLCIHLKLKVVLLLAILQIKSCFYFIQSVREFKASSKITLDVVVALRIVIAIENILVKGVLIQLLF
jgi:nitrogen fixation/metabolism regulation signal transduction histidine kinase